jgi:cytochrome c biogenesis protein CcmG/thiol:disulfide interchange protein DsbE
VKGWTLTALLLVVLGLASCQYSTKPPRIGSAAPDFNLTEDGRTVSLGVLRDKVVVLNFWATWCPPCIDEIPSLQAMQQKLTDRVQVLAVSVDHDEDAYRSFLKEHDLKLLTVRDPRQQVNALYGTFKYPETYIIDRNGLLRRKLVGPADWTRPEILEYLSRL